MSAQTPSDIDWNRVYAEAVAIAATVTQRAPEELVHVGVERFLSGREPWDPSRTTSLAAHLVLAGRKARENAERTERRRWHPKMLGKVVKLFEKRHVSPEEDLAVRQHRAKRFERLLKELADDSEAHALALLVQRGVTEAEEQAEESGMDIAVVRNARKRLNRRVQTLFGDGERDGDDLTDEKK
jgi:hypothetical protein